MKDWIPLLQTLIWPLFAAILLVWGRGAIRAILDAAATRIREGASVEVGPSGLKLGQVVATSDLSKPVVDLQTSQVRTTSYNLAVINRSSVPDKEVESVVAALRKQVHQHLAPIWGVDAEIRFVSRDEAPVPGHWWVEVVDTSDVAGVLGYHTVTPDGLPSARVSVKSSMDAGYAWPAVASHEVLKMLVNPRTNLSVLREGSEGLLYMLEICDACAGDLYSIDDVQVTNFVFPAWYIASQNPGSTQFDYLRHINAPFELMPNGYAVCAGPDVRKGWRHMFGNDQTLSKPGKRSARAPRPRRTTASND
jgi:hypothetical protein